MRCPKKKSAIQDCVQQIESKSETKEISSNLDKTESEVLKVKIFYA